MEQHVSIMTDTSEILRGVRNYRNVMSTPLIWKFAFFGGADEFGCRLNASIAECAA